MSQVTVRKWGTDLAIRLPGDVVAATRISDGERVVIEGHDGHIVIRRAAPHVPLKQLFQDKGPDEWRTA